MLFHAPNKKLWTPGAAQYSAVVAPGFNPGTLNPSLWFEAGSSVLYQSNAGSGTPATANGDPVGFLTDKSSNVFHLSSFANDATRPTLGGVGAKPYLAFDAVGNYLKRAAALGIYNAAGGFSMFFAVRSHGTYTGRYLYCEGFSGGGSPFIGCLKTDDATATTGTCFWRDVASTSIIANGGIVITNAFPATDTVVGLTYDGATSVLGYINQTQTGSITITRQTVTELNQTALGILYRSTNSGFFGDRIYAGIIVKGAPLSTGNRTSLITYLGNLAGLTI